MSEHITPVPGDPSTEPVATAEQSHVDGRVGPPTIAQDATAEAYTPAGVEQIEPGAIVSATTPYEGGPIVTTVDGDHDGSEPVGDAQVGTSAAPVTAPTQPASDVVVVDDQAAATPADLPVKPAPGDSVVAEPVHTPAPSTTAAAPASTPTTDARA